MENIITLLPESYRTILYLREYEEFTYEELGETLNLSLDQVKINLYRARQRFKILSERLGKEFERGGRNGME